MRASHGLNRTIPIEVPRSQSPSPTQRPLEIKYKTKYIPPSMVTDNNGYHINSGTNPVFNTVIYTLKPRIMIAIKIEAYRKTVGNSPYNPS